MNKCCENFKYGHLFTTSEGLYKYCPTCGKKLEREWCECGTRTGYHIKKNGSYCRDCRKRINPTPIKPKIKLPEKIDLEKAQKRTGWNEPNLIHKINEIITFLESK